MAIRQLIYRSTATRILGDAELGRLVEQARIHNFSQLITGVLFYADKQFLQLLEGEPEAVAQLYKHVSEDARHTNIVTVFDAPAPARLFPNWSLGYSHVGALALARLTGYIAPESRATLVPKSYCVQEVITDLLHEFVEEQVLVSARPHQRVPW